MKKLLQTLLILTLCFLPIIASANFAASWNATSTSGTFINPNNINGLSQGLYVTPTSTPSVFNNLNVGLNLTSNLVSEFTLNDNAANTTVTDLTGNDTSAVTTRNTNVVHVNGKIDGAFTYNGTSDILNTNSTYQSTFQNSFSIALWLKVPPVGAGNFVIPVGTGDASSTGAIVMDFDSVPSLGTYYYQGNNFAGVQGNYPNDNAWHHVVFTFKKINNNTITSTFYLDGVLAHSQFLFNPNPHTDTGINMANYLGTSMQPLLIGAQLNSTMIFPNTTSYFKGSIDDFQLYNKALTPSEVSELYADGAGTENVNGDFLTTNWNNAYGASQNTNPIFSSITTSNTATSSVFSGGITVLPFVGSGFRCIQTNFSGQLSATTCPANYWTASGQNIYENTGGNVGIGTSSPWSMLSVEGSSTLGNNAIAGSFTATTTATSTFAGAFSSRVSSQYGGLTVTGNGQVAIGTSSPNENLSVVGSFALYSTSTNRATSQDAPFLFTVGQDPNNTAHSALTISPEVYNSQRLYFSGLYAINFSGVYSFEALPYLLGGTGTADNYFGSSSTAVYGLASGLSGANLLLSPGQDNNPGSESAAGWITGVEGSGQSNSAYRALKFQSWAYDSDVTPASANYWMDTKMVSKTLPHTIWTEGQTNRLMTLTAGGNLGIGTSSPYGTLSVVANNAYNFIVATTTGKNSFKIDNKGNVYVGGDQPTVTCSPSGGSMVSGSSNGSGQITTGTLSTSCTMTFADGGYNTGGLTSCVADNSSAGTVTTGVTSVSNTSVTFGMAALTGTLYYSCENSVNK